MQQDLVCPNCEKPAIGGKVHPLCKKRFGLDGLWSLGIYNSGAVSSFAYQNPLKKSIQKLKYKFVADIADTLTDLTLEYWAKFTPQFIEEIKKDRGEGWVVVPVPLHPKREKWRGFNQSALLGKILASKIGLEYAEALKRTKHTKPQVGLASWERKKNINNAFALNLKFEIKNLKFLLVDDVWTTGSTLKECCYILKRNGAKSVWAITLAR